MSDLGLPKGAIRKLRLLTLPVLHLLVVAQLHRLEDFLAAWKDADPDLPILIEAKIFP